MSSKHNSIFPIQSELDLCIKLEQWRNIGNTNMLLVHCIRLDYVWSSTQLTKFKAENVFRTWDVISTSLINSRVVDSHTELRKHTGMFSKLGLVLDVPPQNILGTHCRDVFFPSHIGTENREKKKNSWKLADAIFSGVGKKGGKKNWPINEGKSYNVIESPFDILSKANFKSYNEILVIGKPGVSLYPGYPPTQEVKVTGIIVDKNNTRSGGLHSYYLNEGIRDLSRLNPGLRVIYM
ncbi:hypothetical protein GJV07_23925 [Enterobacteriaceae bacterium RIT711]|nr:hypothetical protein [Enterobacteriaceae bacterium RIT711]